jgi:peptidyl-prolyl cis-trans isomerase SurA
MRLNRIPLTALALLCAVLLSSCKRSPPANVAAVVNGRAITFDDVEKAYQSQLGAAADRSNEDQVNIQKLEILRSLIDAEIMLQRAEKFGLMAVDADVDGKFNELRAPYTQEEFQKQLSLKKTTSDELKGQLRRELSIRKLLNREINSHITISDSDIANFYNANKASFNLAEPQFHLAQILVTPSADPNVRNLKNDKAQTEDQAKKKIAMIEGRLRQNEDFAMLAQNYSEDPNTSPNGGDLGYIPESALEKASVDLRKMVMTLQPGQISPIIHTQEGYRILKLMSKEPSGQRELNDPRVQQSIRETLQNRKEQLLTAAYYEVARNDSQVRSYLALRIAEKAGMTVK